MYEEDDKVAEEIIDTDKDTSNKTNKNIVETSDSVSTGILELTEIKTHEGKNKSYDEVKTLMLKYAKNGASLNAEIERVSGYLKIEYKIALDIDKASMKLVEPETSINQYINDYLEVSRTYTVTVNSESNNIVSIVITGN